MFPAPRLALCPYYRTVGRISGDESGRKRQRYVFGGSECLEQRPELEKGLSYFARGLIHKS